MNSLFHPDFDKTRSFRLTDEQLSQLKDYSPKMVKLLLAIGYFFGAVLIYFGLTASISPTYGWTIGWAWLFLLNVFNLLLKLLSRFAKTNLGILAVLSDVFDTCIYGWTAWIVLKRNPETGEAREIVLEFNRAHPLTIHPAGAHACSIRLGGLFRSRKGFLFIRSVQSSIFRTKLRRRAPFCLDPFLTIDVIDDCGNTFGFSVQHLLTYCKELAHGTGWADWASRTASERDNAIKGREGLLNLVDDSIERLAATKRQFNSKPAQLIRENMIRGMVALSPSGSEYYYRYRKALEGINPTTKDEVVTA